MQPLRWDARSDLRTHVHMQLAHALSTRTEHMHMHASDASKRNRLAIREFSCAACVLWFSKSVRRSAIRRKPFVGIILIHNVTITISIK